MQRKILLTEIIRRSHSQSASVPHPDQLYGPTIERNDPLVKQTGQAPRHHSSAPPSPPKLQVQSLFGPWRTAERTDKPLPVARQAITLVPALYVVNHQHLLPPWGVSRK